MGKSFTAALLALCMILTFTISGCGKDSVPESDLIRDLNNTYGTQFIYGDKIVTRAPTDSSKVVDWRNAPEAEIKKQKNIEEVSDIIYKHGVNTDGVDKDSDLPLSMRIIYNTKNDIHHLQPVVIFIPGGGFISCKSEGKYQTLFSNLTKNGYAIAVIQYHVIGQGVYSDAEADVADAVKWIQENALKYNLDKDNIALVGTSGGGYLAAYTACKDPSGIKAVVNFYGLSDIANCKADYSDEAVGLHHMATSTDSQFVNGVYSGIGIADEESANDDANPLNYINGDEPPFLNFHGDEDLIVSPSQTQILHDALLKAGDKSTRYSLTGDGHGTKGFRTGKAMKVTVKFLDKYLK